MKSAIVFSMMILGLVGFLNLGEPQRLALDDGNKIKHQSLTSVTQDAGGPERLATDDSHTKIEHNTLSSVTQDAGGPQRLAYDDGWIRIK